ncbi:MAG TPA: RDD family protein [Phycisphaerae bacterium]|nr:RDD family protein [Phycisphaerae bacterium]
MAVEPNSVYFAPADYAHPARRLGALVIDLAFLVAVLIAVYLQLAYVVVPQSIRSQRWSPEVQREIDRHVKPIMKPLTWAWFAFCAAYHIGLRRTRGGTLGYRLMGIRLVDEAGQAPAVRRLFRRFLLAIPSTLFLGASYFSCFTSPRRQTAHDKWSGTWAVRKRALPAGPALISYHTKFFGTFPTTYIDVEPLPAGEQSALDPKPAGQPQSSADEPLTETVHR